MTWPCSAQRPDADGRSVGTALCPVDTTMHSTHVEPLGFGCRTATVSVRAHDTTSVTFTLRHIWQAKHLQPLSYHPQISMAGALQRLTGCYLTAAVQMC